MYNYLWIKSSAELIVRKKLQSWVKFTRKNTKKSKQPNKQKQTNKKTAFEGSFTKVMDVEKERLINVKVILAWFKQASG